jgi:hypothetical protein
VHVANEAVQNGEGLVRSAGSEGNEVDRSTFLESYVKYMSMVILFVAETHQDDK